MEIEKTILNMLAAEEYGEITDATAESKIQDLGLHSLDFICLVSDLEEEYGIDVPNDTRLKVQTVGDLVKIVEELIETKTAA